MNRVSRNLSRDECVEMTTLMGEGHFHRALAQRIGVSQSAIFRVMQHYRETGDYVRRPGLDKEDLRMLAVRERFTNT
jgi:transposase